VDDADERTADVALRPLDIDPETGAAHERDALLRQKRLHTIKIVTDGAVRHMQETRKRKEFQRLICHKESGDEH